VDFSGLRPNPAFSAGAEVKDKDMTEQNKPTYDEQKLKEDLQAFMNAAKFAMVVTNGADGWPMARIMGYVPEGWDIWLTTVAGSLKAREMGRDNKVTILWKEPSERFFQFLTLKGEVEVFDDRETVDRVRKLYGERYGGFGSGEGVEQMQRVVMRVRVNYARAEGFGVRPPAIIRNF
jgi:general stress protein 26